MQIVNRTKNCKLALVCLLLIFGMSPQVFAQLDVSPPLEVKAPPGATITIPVILSNPNADPIDAFGLTFSYPTNLLTFIDCDNSGTLTDGWIVAGCQENVPGIVTIGGFNTTATVASGVLINVIFEVKLDAPIGECGALQFNNFSDDLADASTTDGEFCVECDPSACADAAVIFPMPEGGVKGDPVEGSDGDTIWVDIQIKDNPQAIGAFGFIVQVNPAQLAFISAEAGDLTGGFVVVDAQENFQGLGSGVITCGGFGTTPVPVGSAGSLIRLRFVVSCAEGDSSDITISNLSDDVVGLAACCNRFYCVVCREDGDVNNDGNLTPGDALCAFKVFLNGQTVPADCDIPDWDCEVIAGDVNCDGTVTPGDALSIFQRFLSGLPPEKCFAQAGSRLAKRSSRAEPYRLSLVQRTVLQSAQAGGSDLIELSLRVDNPEGLAAFGLGLSYPAEKLDFLGIRRTALTQEWIELDGRSNAPGELLIGGFNIDAVETVAAGDLFELIFASKGQSIRADEFGIIELTDDLSDALLSAEASGLSGVATVPTAFKLYQSYPNPFQGHSAQDAVIRFDLAGSEAVQVELSIYNITGQQVRRLATGRRTPGQYEISWDGRNDSGLQLPSGTYFYRLKAGDFVDSRYLSVVR